MVTVWPVAVCRGRKKHVWLSISSDLRFARRPRCHAPPPPPLPARTGDRISHVEGDRKSLQLGATRGDRAASQRGANTTTHRRRRRLDAIRDLHDIGAPGIEVIDGCQVRLPARPTLRRMILAATTGSTRGSACTARARDCCPAESFERCVSDPLQMLQKQAAKNLFSSGPKSGVKKHTPAPPDTPDRVRGRVEHGTRNAGA